MFSKKTLILLLLACSSSFAHSNSTRFTQVGRYAEVKNSPLISQVNLLQQTVQIHFPGEVQTIQQAIDYLLRFSGYQLVKTQSKISPSFRSLLSKSLPISDRKLGPMSLQQALLTLAGEPFQLLVDPIHRLISFRLRPDYQKLYASQLGKHRSH